MAKTLITGANGFIGKYIRRQLASASEKAADDIITLGLADNNHIKGDLTRAVPPLADYEFDTVYHLVGAIYDGDRRLLNVVATNNLLTALEARPPRNLVVFSTTDIYGLTAGELIDETAPLNPATQFAMSKHAMEINAGKWAESHGVNLTILRLPLVIGTGMTGEARRLLNRIYRGSYHHIAGNEARCSVIHAIDVARMAETLAPAGGIFNLTDGVDPSRHDLAEAIAHRLSDKRIFTLSEKRARRWAFFNDFIPGTWLTRQNLKRELSTLTFNSSAARNASAIQPINTVEYLLTHNYDNDEF